MSRRRALLAMALAVPLLLPFGAAGCSTGWSLTGVKIEDPALARKTAPPTPAPVSLPPSSTVPPK